MPTEITDREVTTTKPTREDFMSEAGAAWDRLGEKGYEPTSFVVAIHGEGKEDTDEIASDGSAYGTDFGLRHAVRTAFEAVQSLFETKN